MGMGGAILPSLTKLRMLVPLDRGSKTMGAKVHQSKGEQPRPSFKVPKSMLSVKGSEMTPDNQDVGLEAAII